MPISSCNLLDHVQSETHARQISVISRKIHRLSLSVDELKDFFRQAPATFHIPCEYLALICFQGGLGRGNTDEKYLQQMIEEFYAVNKGEYIFMAHDQKKKHFRAFI